MPRVLATVVGMVGGMEEGVGEKIEVGVEGSVVHEAQNYCVDLDLMRGLCRTTSMQEAALKFL